MNFFKVAMVSAIHLELANHSLIHNVFILNYIIVIKNATHLHTPSYLVVYIVHAYMCITIYIAIRIATYRHCNTKSNGN